MGFRILRKRGAHGVDRDGAHRHRGQIAAAGDEGRDRVEVLAVGLDGVRRGLSGCRDRRGTRRTTPDARDPLVNHQPRRIRRSFGLFVNQHDTRAIGDTILILPDSAAATTTLNTTVSSIGTIVTGGSPQPSPVGTGGTVVSGTSPDGSKAVTVLLFTEGRAVVLLEFGSAPGDPMPPQVVTDVGKKQEIAIRTGMPG